MIHFTNLQLLTPDELRGRMMSLFQLTHVGMTPLGALFTGAVIERSGGSTGFLVDGGLGLVTALALVLWWRRKNQPLARGELATPPPPP